MTRYKKFAVCLLSTSALAPAATAQDVTFGLEGNAGLIDMPVAGMFPDWETAASYSHFAGTSRYSIGFQLLPRLETTVHYGTIGSLGPDGLFDASIDLKYQLLAETETWPAVALGFRDFLSNGVYSSEYLVASKTLARDFTVTGGVGWGRLGTANVLGQPFGPRAPQIATEPGIDHLFQGDVGAFGGIEWRTPVDGLSLKAEYSSDAYVQEAGAGGISPKTQWNFGLDYAPFDGVSLGAYYNYGTEFGLRVTFHGNPRRPVVSPDLGSGPVPIKARPAGYSTDSSWTENAVATTALAGGLVPVLAAEGIVLEEMRLGGDTIDLYVRNQNMPYMSKAVGRIARTLTVALPPSIEVFRITPVTEAGLAAATLEIRRADIEAQAETPDAGPRSWQTTRVLDAENHLDGDGTWRRAPDSRFEWAIFPTLPVNFAAEDVGLDGVLNGTAAVRLGDGFSLNAAVSQRLFTTVDLDMTPSPSPTPVRSNFALYNDGSPSLDRLTADYLFKPGADTFARISAGYLETMFAGVSGEVLWKPVGQNWGLGLELNAVQQRDPDQLFGLDDYQTVSGHGSLYVDTGFHDLEAQLDVGRYLAGDYGATFTLSRHFPNGWEVSGFMTLTEMSFADFGAGNFAKGIEVTIPLRWTMPVDTRSTLGVSMGTFTGDGGARVDVANRLYPMVRDYDEIDFEETWGAYWQ